MSHAEALYYLACPLRLGDECTYRGEVAYVVSIDRAAGVVGIAPCTSVGGRGSECAVARLVDVCDTDLRWEASQ